jgi:hypothetical protein
VTIIPRFCILFTSRTRGNFIFITIIATSGLKQAVINGGNMTYADCLSKVLVGTSSGGVPLGVDASSSESDNRGRLI